MKKLKGWLILFSIFFTLSAKGGEIGDSLKSARVRVLTYNITDTPFLPLIIEKPTILSQNTFFKRRLDSLQSDLSLDYNEHVQTFIDVLSTKGKGKISRMLGLSKYYFPIYEKVFREQNLPAELKFLSIVESELNPFAVSRSGAVGLWQFMYTTAKGYHLQMDSWVDERKDPIASSNAAALYLRDAYNLFGDWLLAIASYNCGTGCVSRALAKSGGTTFWDIRNILPVETQNYVPAFIATTYLMNYYQKHNIMPMASDLEVETDVLWVDQKISLADIAKAAEFDFKQLSILNPSYKRQIINGSAQSPKRLIIPAVNKDVYNSLYQVLNNESVSSEFSTVAFESKELTTGIYRAKEGETLQDIANEYSVEVQDLRVWNNLKQAILVPGQSIRVSAPNPEKHRSPKFFTYKVRQGDTLSKIASKFKGVSISELKTANKLSRTKLKAGMLLRILKG